MAAYVASNDKSVLQKSYEDAKVSKTQRMTHEEILALGHKIFEKNNQKEEHVLKEELANLRTELLKSFEEENQTLLQEASIKYNLELKRELDEAKVVQQKMVKEESKRTKAKMAEVARKQVEEERKAGKQRLQKEIQIAKEEFEKEKASAMAIVRRQEQNNSIDKINELMKQQEENISKLKLEAEITKKNALDEQRKMLDRVKEEALESLKSRMEAETEKRLEQRSNEHEKKLDMKSDEIDEQKCHSDKLMQEISHLQEMRKETEEKLAAVMDSYQNFINSQPGFSQGQADFLLSNLLSSPDK